ncbi:lytic transglycosylase domain-containing protein [Microbispora sp. NBRC 16548]|uniref:lytic transglycosylase domain-containing protein n=1 Tax=Microbispora sp. NBRC 16548 TaxID=3030994 RepID=UPI0024A1E64D|nr:lytic transglycosylase domain-containing protein [Microbispora sp. NBRC 16548]GLX06793.1 hypothetical protein Misp03_37200 [Microbispora sp. NBRC 16548]
MRKYVLVGLVLGTVCLFMPLALVMALAALAPGTSSGSSTSLTSEPARVTGIPDDYLRLYVAAARTCSGLGWHVLAGIGKIETNHGRSNLPGVHSGTNFAGAAGPMQFLISTWGGQPKIRTSSGAHGYATDGDGDGWGDVYNPADAIFAAAKYLCAAGVDDIRRAVYAYNHSWAYVDNVLSAAAQYLAQTQPVDGDSTSGTLNPEQPSGAERITPRMRTVRDLIRAQFHLSYAIGCYRADGAIRGGGEHPRGRACDFMVVPQGGRLPSASQQALGDAIAAWAQGHARQLGIYYVIWKQHIWNPSRANEGWRLMNDRGSITDNHYDHVHISVL